MKVQAPTLPRCARFAAPSWKKGSGFTEPWGCFALGRPGSKTDVQL